MSLNEGNYLFLPGSQVTAPIDGLFFQCYRDFWWYVVPDKGLVFYNPLILTGPRTGFRRHSWLGRPQCNSDKRILLGGGKHYPFATEVRQFPIVFVPITLSDYCHN
jgi:hypothetical protein